MRKLLHKKCAEARNEMQLQDPFIIDLDFYEMLYTRRLKKYFNMFFNYGLDQKRQLEAKIMSRGETTDEVISFLKNFYKPPKALH